MLIALLFSVPRLLSNHDRVMAEKDTSARLRKAVRGCSIYIWPFAMLILHRKQSLPCEASYPAHRYAEPRFRSEEIYIVGVGCSRRK